MAKYLVTGGAGFIGSHLTEKLLALGCEITILDSQPVTETRLNSKKINYIQGSILDKKLINNLMDEISGCFHLAAIASVFKCQDEWLDSHQVNLSGTINIFEAAAKAKKDIPVIYTSSAAIYGDNPSLPLSESSAPTPLTAYGIDKYGCELHAELAYKSHGVPNIGLRPFNVYGPYQDPSSPYSGVISKFLKNITENKAIDIYGDGEQTRDFVHVRDVVNYFIAAMEAKNKSGEVYNICTGSQTSINNLANILADILNKPLEKNYLPEKNGDIKNSNGYAKKALEELNIKAEIKLRQGLWDLSQSYKL